MSDEPDKQRSEANAELEREIRQGRKFTVQEAMARMIAPGAMKGGSPASRAAAFFKTPLRPVTGQYPLTNENRLRSQNSRGPAKVVGASPFLLP
jgi:hypothetical protein